VDTTVMVGEVAAALNLWQGHRTGKNYRIRNPTHQYTILMAFPYQPPVLISFTHLQKSLAQGNVICSIGAANQVGCSNGNTAMMDCGTGCSPGEVNCITGVTYDPCMFEVCCDGNAVTNSYCTSGTGPMNCNTGPSASNYCNNGTNPMAECRWLSCYNTLGCS